MPQLSSTTRVVVAVSFFIKSTITCNLSQKSRFLFQVEDINDHSPEFDQKFYKFQIPANAEIDQSLFQVSFVDALFYSFLFIFST